MSYDEHLISTAGGDGETVDRLAAIEARALNGDPSYHSHANAMEDRRTLLALVREQQAKLDRVLELACWAGKRGWQIAPATLRSTINEASA